MQKLTGMYSKGQADVVIVKPAAVL